MLAQMKGREGNLPVGTHIRSLTVSGPLDGAPDAPTAGHLCVALSLALGGSDLIQWVSPSNSELCQTPQQSWDPFWIWLPYPTM
jgi:hypothetical protein